QGGGGVGPSLRASRLTREAMEAVIRRGASGMPAFPDLKDTEVKALLDLVDRWKTGSR
ncbi:c-type cytochrome, partial [Deinococcus pimensis]|uniref:c-type cytochrome n=1 Tax=Deinococcus pimensis TaxID=309888 RepID=UPI00146F9A7D